MSEREPGAEPASGTAGEYRFHMDAFTPGTIPMARLGEYMSQLAAMLGEQAAVHFVRLESGSTVLVHRVDGEARARVKQRTDGLRRGDAPRDAIRAYRTLNRMLRQDDGNAKLVAPASDGVVLNFPGRQQAEEETSVVKQEGTITGQLVRVGGTEKNVPVLLFAEGEKIPGCYADRAVAKQLARRLFDFLRLHGTGRWRRDSNGAWSLDTFKVRSFDVLEPGGLAAVVAELRQLGAEIDPGAYEELSTIRHGLAGRDDGGS